MQHMRRVSGVAFDRGQWGRTACSVGSIDGSIAGLPVAIWGILTRSDSLDAAFRVGLKGTADDKKAHL